MKKKQNQIVPKTPVRFSIEVVDKVCEQIALGKSLVEICKQEGMPTREGFHCWVREKPEVAHKYARAREDQADALADEIVRIADTDPDPVRARVRVDARKWVAAKLKPKKYGDKLEIDGTVTVAARITEQLKRARERLINYGEVIDVTPKEAGEDDIFS